MRHEADFLPPGARGYAFPPVQTPGRVSVKDPVCGMEVDEAQAPAAATCQGQTYYFCNLNCKKSFDAEPEKYARG